jgi:NADPH:quinone reductase-like Zn-dependent oxidoreductase
MVAEDVTELGLLFCCDGARTAASARWRRRPSGYVDVRIRPRAHDLTRPATLVDRGLLWPPVTGTCPLDRVAEAHRDLAGPAVGELVLTLPAAPVEAAPR